MQHTYEEVRQRALELPYDDRAKLSQELWESLHPPAELLPQEEIDAAWDEEIKHRIEDLNSGAAKFIP
jgi:putative addiction module component (TIGR02574 family)